MSPAVLTAEAHRQEFSDLAQEKAHSWAQHNREKAAPKKDIPCCGLREFVLRDNGNKPLEIILKQGLLGDER